MFSLSKAVTLQGSSLIEELEDAIYKNKKTPISYSELAALKEGRFNASIQHRLAELEGIIFLYSLGDISYKKHISELSLPKFVFLVL